MRLSVSTNRDILAPRLYGQSRVRPSVQRHGAAPDADTADSLVLLPAPQSLEETERLVAEGQGLPPPEIPLSTLPDHHLGDGLLGGLLDEVGPDDDRTDAHVACHPA